MGSCCRRDSRGCGSLEIDPEAPGTEGCVIKPDRKDAVRSFGTRIGAERPLCRAPGPSQRKNSALVSIQGRIVLARIPSLKS